MAGLKTITINGRRYEGRSDLVEQITNMAKEGRLTDLGPVDATAKTQGPKPAAATDPKPAKKPK